MRTARWIIAGLMLAAVRVSAQEPEVLGRMARAIGADTAAEVAALDGCVRIHHLWKPQVLTLAEGGDSATVAARLAERVYRPWPEFWRGYLGDEAVFLRWAMGRWDLAGDGRRVLPYGDPAGLIVRTTERMAELTGRRACADWYLVFGPGWTNMGGLGDARMVLDFHGVRWPAGMDDVRMTLPHELNHVLFGAAHDTLPGAGTLLHRIVDEGFATWMSDWYFGPGYSATEALGYSDAEYAWALAHEQELWDLARPLLSRTDRETQDRFAAANAHLLPDAPGKIGYFLGYRIVASFVARHGPDSWRRLYDLPVEAILRESAYTPADSPTP